MVSVRPSSKIAIQHNGRGLVGHNKFAIDWVVLFFMLIQLSSALLNTQNKSHTEIESKMHQAHFHTILKPYFPSTLLQNQWSFKIRANLETPLASYNYNLKLNGLTTLVSK